MSSRGDSVSTDGEGTNATTTATTTTSYAPALPEFLKNALERLDAAKSDLDASISQISKRVDNSISDASFRIGKSVEIAKESTEDALATAEAHAAALVDKIRTKEDLFFKTATEKVWAVLKEYPNASAATAATVGLLTLPPVRRLLWKSSFGRFETEEQIFAQLTRRAQSVKEGAVSAERSMSTYQEETRAAISEMNSGITKLKTLSAQLRRSEKSAESSLLGVEDVLRELRTTPGDEAVALRSEVATVQASFEKQRREAMKELKKMYKQGIEI